jgi:hypothetical protein
MCQLLLVDGSSCSISSNIKAHVLAGLFGCELKPPPEGQHIITTTRSHITDVVKDAVAACEPTSELRVGGAGHKVKVTVHFNNRSCRALMQLFKNIMANTC